MGVAREISKLQKRIQKLQETIKGLKSKCSHQWRIVKKPDLTNSLVAGVHVGSVEGQSRVTVACPATLDFTYECKRCGSERRGNAMYNCPKCFEKLEERRPLGDRAEYFGFDYSYYAVQISSCPKCDFRIASDIYDR